MTKDNLSKSAWRLFELAKEITKTNLVTAVNTGKLKVDEASLPTLLSIIDASISEGYNKGHKNFLDSATKETKKKK